MSVLTDARVFSEDIINTGRPVKEIRVEGDSLVIVKESGEERIALNTLRGKAIYTRLTTGVSEFTEPIYV